MTDIYLTIKPKRQDIAHKWETSIMRSITGKEQRSALFTWPRMESNLQFKRGNNDKANWLRRHMISDGHKIWGIPIWPDEVELDVNASSGQAILDLDTDDRHFYAGREVMLLNKTDWTDYEVGEIDSIIAGQITLTQNLSATWNKSTTRVYPVYDFRLPFPQTISKMGARLDTWSIDAKEDVSGTLQYTYTAPATPATYYGHPLLDYPAQSNRQFVGNHPYASFMGFGRSYIDSYYDGLDTHINQDYDFFLEGRSDIRGLLDFFDSRMGRLSPFWAPTWNRDLIPTAAIGASDTVISVKDYEYDELYIGNDVINRYLLIGMPDRNLLVRKITAASATSITLDNSLGAEIKESALTRLLLSFLVFSRFGNDRIEISYRRGTLADINLRTIGLVEEAVS